jgi:ribosomal subunit interface protein
MEIIFKGRQTDVPARFREQATAKLGKIEKLDQKALRVDVEILVERNPRQTSHKERVELTIRSPGPTIRAEAAAEDRFVALDLAVAKLDSRVRRALDRRKSRHSGHGLERREAEGQPAQAAKSEQPAGQLPGEQPEPWPTAEQEATPPESASSVVPIEMVGNAPVVVRQKFHQSPPISLDQALLEMELVGHDFYLFHDVDQDMPSVIYRRRGYQYGVIRLVDSQTGATSSESAPTLQPR